MTATRYIVEHLTRGVFMEWVGWPEAEQAAGRPRFSWSKNRTDAQQFLTADAALAMRDRIEGFGIGGCYVLAHTGVSGERWHDVVTGDTR